MPTATDAGDTAPIGDVDPASPSSANIRVGDVVAGRYRVEAFLGCGGMGEVFRARDLLIDDLVALKTIRREHTSDRGALDGFLREIQLAHKVTHPNVCRVFDLVRHADAAGSPILSMELLEGETLLSRVRRAGPMSADEALPIALQLAAGLAAAHAAGIVHRDLKPSNILLVPGPLRERAVIIDFGVARLHAVAHDEGTTGGGRIVGTPTYLAPEQLCGRPITPAADIYALGAVLYHMVTGRPPFQGDTPVATASLRLTSEPVPPTAFAPSLPPMWQEVILRCLARAPERRPSRATDVAEALARGPRRNIGRAAACACVALAAVVLLAARVDTGAPARRDRGAVAILDLRDTAPGADTAWIGPALSEMLRSELATADLRSIRRDRVARAAAELGREDVVAMRELLGTEQIVTGSYAAGGGMVHAKLRLIVAGEVVEVREIGDERGLAALAARAGARLRARLGATAGPEVGAVGASPLGLEARRRYGEGLARLHALDAPAAIELLGEAAELEPGFAPAHAALAEAWLLGGDRVQSASEARLAYERSGPMSPEDRLVLEARYHEAAGAWDRATAVRRALWTAFPDDLEHGVALARVQNLAGRPAEATATVARLRTTSDDVRLDLEEALARAPDKVAARRLVERAAARARAAGARLLEADTLLARARLLPGARASARLACVLYGAAGDRRGEIEALLAIGDPGSLREAAHLMTLTRLPSRQGGATASAP